MTGRIFEHGAFDAQDLLDAKGTTTISVVLPARNEATTVGGIVNKIHHDLVAQVPLIDELIVIDDLSSDTTAAIAAEAGATVYPSSQILPDHGSGGKGEALWKSLFVSTGDLVIWCDADIRNFDNRFILGCIGPLLTDGELGFIKGFYRRPLRDDGEGGGRVTELMARPLIASLFPDLAALVQPLSGEFGGRRELLEALPFSRGYAVDLGLLIDFSRRFGANKIGQVDLGTRIHRNRPLRELGPQSGSILAMALRRTGVEIPDGVLAMPRPQFGDAEVPVGDLPSIASIRASIRASRSTPR